MPTNIPLEVIDIPRPCPADWNAMHGNSRVRFCDHCQKNVFNLSEMTREAAEALVARHEGQLCARLYRRNDGTVITTDCRGGWTLRAWKMSRTLAGACAALLGGILIPQAWADRVAAPEPMRPAVAGEIAVPMQGAVPALKPTTQPTTKPADQAAVRANVAPEMVKKPPTTQPTTKPAETIQERRARLPRPQMSNMPERIEAPPAKEQAMPATLSLNVIDIARPCPADWDAMRGDDRSRYCDHCKKHVFNLSAMTREAAEQLIIEKEGKFCAKLYRRDDGTVITADCGGGWKLRAKKLGTLVGVACAAVLSGICAPLVYSRESIESGQVMNDAPPARLVERVILKLKGAPPAPPINARMMLGDVMFIPPAKTNPTPPNGG